MIGKTYEARDRRAKIALSILAPLVGMLALWGAPVAAASTPSWYNAGVALKFESKNAEWKGILKVTYEQPGLGHVTAECNTTGKGTVGHSGNAGISNETSSTISSCHQAWCPPEQTLSIEVTNLPRPKELAYEGSTILNKNKTEKLGEFEVEEEYKVTMKCGTQLWEKVTWKPKEVLKNLASGEVEATYRAETVQGNVGHYLIEGNHKFKLTQGGALSVK